jgi:inhibitor of KinA sporulation pathway (predicted exonuclease)
MTDPGGAIIILDLEFTSWEGSWQRAWTGPGEVREIVQVGMIKLIDDRELTEIDSFEVLVRPRANPTLSEYFIDLTGITQADVDERGVTFPQALEAALAFIGDGARTIHSFGHDEDWIGENCQMHDIASPTGNLPFHNVRRDFSDRLNMPEQSLRSGQLPEIMNFSPAGSAHDAVSDCRCIAEGVRIFNRRDRG